jgi:WD40 repeat protein
MHEQGIPLQKHLRTHLSIFEKDLLTSFSLLQTLYMHNSEVWCLQFSPCGRYLASGAKGNQVLIWRIESAKKVHIHQSIQILQVCF